MATGSDRSVLVPSRVGRCCCVDDAGARVVESGRRLHGVDERADPGRVLDDPWRGRARRSGAVLWADCRCRTHPAFKDFHIEFWAIRPAVARTRAYFQQSGTAGSTNGVPRRLPEVWPLL